ncbi:MAG: hypothetical protein FWD60_04985 [Candidatus Azobacteroides sp.]|nr:hypothetical protein [Candidatus Azobacteroides sp.]
MKKLVLFAVIVVAVSFVSCKQKAAEPVAPVQDVVAVDTTAAVPTDTVAAPEVK